MPIGIIAGYAITIGLMPNYQASIWIQVVMLLICGLGYIFIPDKLDLGNLDSIEDDNNKYQDNSFNEEFKNVLKTKRRLTRNSFSIMNAIIDEEVENNLNLTSMNSNNLNESINFDNNENKEINKNNEEPIQHSLYERIKHRFNEYNENIFKIKEYTHCLILMNAI